MITTSAFPDIVLSGKVILLFSGQHQEIPDSPEKFWTVGNPICKPFRLFRVNKHTYRCSMQLLQFVISNTTDTAAGILSLALVLA